MVDVTAPRTSCATCSISGPTPLARFRRDSLAWPPMARQELWRDRGRCNRARRARDAAYDGRFFTCVRTTRIYCRPVCRSALARTDNVFFVPSTAEAERLGFRPCLRCRPDAAPGTAAWRGTAATVARGLRLIGTGFLDSHRVSALASRLGVSARHLTRLFIQHVGLSPAAVAGTRRVQAAKRLTSDTDRPLTQIAFEAGFRSVRRFNDAFRRTYKQPPSRFRQSRRASTIQPDG